MTKSALLGAVALVLTVTAASAAEAPNTDWKSLVSKLPPTNKAQMDAMIELSMVSAAVAFCPQFKLNQYAVDILYRSTGAPFKDPTAVKFMQAFAANAYGDYEKAAERAPAPLWPTTKKEMYCRSIFNVQERKGNYLLQEK
jgi:roadblock/LC7 domain-containing protein